MKSPCQGPTKKVSKGGGKGIFEWDFFKGNNCINIFPKTSYRKCINSHP